jgi:hypothetical protein
LGRGETEEEEEEEEEEMGRRTSWFLDVPSRAKWNSVMGVLKRLSSVALDTD